MRKSALFWFGLVVTALVALGLIVLSSASFENALRLTSKPGVDGDPYFFMKRQFAFLGGGVLLAACVAMFDYRRWRDDVWLSWLFYAVVMVLLLAVFGFDAVNGSHRWIALGPLRLQPSEFAKLATVVLLSVWLDRLGWKVETFVKGALWPAALIGVIALPILVEPDFGSVMVVGFAGFLLMLVAGTRLLHMAPFLCAGIGVVAYKVMTNANRMARIAAFFGIKLDVGAQVLDEAAKRAAYQADMALAAIGNGGIWGVGLGESMQKWRYLPEAHTDFVFAIGAEELGLPFSIGVLLLFAAFFALSVYIARKAGDRFGRFLVIGMAFIIFFQAMFNLGVVCKALPTKGMALPFFSYGGTNLLSTFFAVGTILSVGIHTYRDRQHQLVRKVLARR